MESRDGTGRDEREAALEWIPRAVRDALDRVAIRLHLREWQALPLDDRAALAALAQQSPLDTNAFAAALRRLVLTHCGHPPEPLRAAAARRGATTDRRGGA